MAGTSGRANHPRELSGVDTWVFVGSWAFQSKGWFGLQWPCRGLIGSPAVPSRSPRPFPSFLMHCSVVVLFLCKCESAAVMYPPLCPLPQHRHRDERGHSATEIGTEGTHVNVFIFRYRTATDIPRQRTAEREGTSTASVLAGSSHRVRHNSSPSRGPAVRNEYVAESREDQVLDDCSPQALWIGYCCYICVCVLHV